MNIKSSSIALFLLANIFFSSYGQDANAIIESINKSLVSVEGGSFTMGSEVNERNEAPIRSVTLSSFYMLSTEVTQEQYKAVMGVNYSHFKSPNRPVEEVSWYDAIVFCNRLSMLLGLEPVYSIEDSTNPSDWGEVPRILSEASDKEKWNDIVANFSADGYRLPTEAEWEYAAKGGKNEDGFLYSGSDNILDVAWTVDSLEGETRDVAAKSPNKLGLYDMSGNVWEWCWDWYNAYSITDVDNPSGGSKVATGRKIRRGGSICSDKRFCRISNRASSAPDVRGADLGFRIVRSIPAKPFLDR